MPAKSACTDRGSIAIDIVQTAATLALERFRDRERLTIDQKGLQDWVSDADRAVEAHIRQQLIDRLPDDAIVGEEEDDLHGTSGFTWVIDPIDGTTNFVNGIPGWCVVLAGVEGNAVTVAAIMEPVSGELFFAEKGRGAFCNEDQMQVATTDSLDQGTVVVGHNTRINAEGTLSLLRDLLTRGGMFRRSGSGALDLCYVAAGRLIGYVEPHMNAWDCLAALLLIEEAGGLVQPYDTAAYLQTGGRVVAAPPGLYPELQRIAADAYEHA